MAQYAKSFSDALQFMWGKGFLSPGGPAEVHEMIGRENIAGKSILDIGSGVGGVDLILVKELGAGEVIGIDVEERLVAEARALVAEEGLDDRIQFQLVEPGGLPFPDQRFDLVFSKDAMVHIPDKAGLYREVLRVLKPGGVFVAADWLWKEGAETSPVVVKWLSAGPLKFAFTTPPEAEAALRAAGFEGVEVKDCRATLQLSNRDEIKALEGPAMPGLIAAVGQEMALRRLASARGRQGALDSGDLIPSHLRGRKPA